MINTKFAKRKLKYYLQNNMDYSNDQSVINVFLAYILSGDVDNAKILADHLILNGFTFDRSSKIPGNIPYALGENPGILLQYCYGLKKLYEMTGVSSYLSEYTGRLSVLNDDMDTGIFGAGLTSFALLYDSNYNLIPTFRSGSYTSDLFPAIWYLSPDFSHDAESIQKIKEAFQDFASKTGIELGFTPFFNLEINENGSYGEFKKWFFSGPSGDETDFYHQYKTVFNLAFYYFEMYRVKGKRDLKLKELLDKFFEYIVSRTELPSSLSYEMLYAGNENIPAGSVNIFAGQENIYNINYGEFNHKHAAMLAIACILKFKVDKEDNVLTYAENILTSIINNQTSNGSFGFPDQAGFDCQSFIYMAFVIYENLTQKSYYDIINEAFMLMNIDRINETNDSVHQQKNVLGFCEEKINDILTKRAFEFTHTETSLPYVSGVYEYNLYDLGIDPHRIECIGFHKDGIFVELYEKPYTEFLNLRNRDASKRQPVYFSVNQNKLYIYYEPDMDYSIKVWHYKLEDSSLNFGKIPTLIPQEWAHVLKWAIANEVATNRDNKLQPFFELWERRTLSNLTYNDSVDMSEEYQRASSVVWG